MKHPGLVALALIVACILWIVAHAQNARGDTFRFRQPDAERTTHEFQLNGAPFPATFRKCSPPAGTMYCATTADLTEPYCYNVIAIRDGFRVPAANGPRCRVAFTGCTCDRNGDGAVGMDDVMLQLSADPPNLALVSVCMDEMREVAAC